MVRGWKSFEVQVRESPWTVQRHPGESSERKGEYIFPLLRECKSSYVSTGKKRPPQNHPLQFSQLLTGPSPPCSQVSPSTSSLEKPSLTTCFKQPPLLTILCVPFRSTYHNQKLLYQFIYLLRGTCFLPFLPSKSKALGRWDHACLACDCIPKAEDSARQTGGIISIC